MSLYYESHITIEPVFGEDLEHIVAIANTHGYRVADLLMKKRKEDTPTRSEYDTFMTSRSTDYSKIVMKMRKCVAELRNAGYTVWREKIEYVVYDKRYREE